ncbi:SseB family protein [Paractinoplanes maris]|uniref:SseB family protein n=1 Tax=Paractinoplanes maris TaxID=1734446 RepID=UPI00202018CA|nr:SseB family protein [Actinoplanes maris]
MSEWEPATDAEVAMRDALRTDDQESYFRILSGVDLLLPVSADALAGLAPLGWGTWSTGGRTHVLAFTSTAALQSCLADYTGSARRVPYAELANTWPNLEWWLAVNPGLPIEGYLPAWFVAQLSRGDLRLPTRGPGRADSKAGAGKIQDLHSAAVAANAATARQEEEAGRPGGPTHEGTPLTAATGSYPHYPSGTYGQQSQTPAATPAAYGQQTSGAPAAYGQQTSGAPAAYGQQAPAAYNAQAPAAYNPQTAGAPPAYGQAAANTYGGAYAQQPGQPPADTLPARTPAAGEGLPNRTPSADDSLPTRAPADGQPPRTPSIAGSLPLRTPPATNGLPSRTPSAADSLPTRTPSAYGRPGATAPASAPPASAPPATNRPTSGPPETFGRPASAPPAYGQPAAVPPAYGQPAAVPPAYGQPAAVPPAYGQPAAVPPAYGQPAAAPPTYGRPASAPPAYGQPTSPAGNAPARPDGFGQPAAREAVGSRPEPTGPAGLPIRTPGTVLPNGLPVRSPGASPASPSPAAPTAVPSAYQSPPVPPVFAPPVSAPPVPAPTGRGDDPRGPLQDLGAPLPVRTPMAQTPPVPEHITPHNPDETPFDPAWSGATGAPSGALGALPRRQQSDAGFPQGPASPQAAAAQRPAAMAPISAPPAPPAAAAAPSAAPSPAPPMQAQPSPGFGTPLPRRQATSPSERPGLTSFPAFQTKSEAPSPSVAPPVIPGTPGSDRPARLGAQPAFETAEPPRAAPPAPVAEAFVPANDVERDLFDAAGGHSTDAFLSTLLLATVLVPVANHSRPGSSPGESGFAFRTEQVDGETFLIVFTSKDRLAEHFAEPTRTVGVRFYELIRNWPDPAWSFAVNPTGPIGAKYPGPQVIALASWAAESGLGLDPDSPVEDAAPVPPPEPANDDAQHATVMQKTIPPDQVDYYLERGYDRVAGFVHRATEVEHLRTPAELFGALGLSYDGSPHQADVKEAYVLRWPAYRPSLYRIPYGGQNEQALKAMDGWVIERPPFRGNGFAPGEGRDVVAEFKVDSVRLPHGAQLWRIDIDGTERMVAIFDNDGPVWRRVGEQ